MAPLSAVALQAANAWFPPLALAWTETVTPGSTGGSATGCVCEGPLFGHAVAEWALGLPAGAPLNAASGSAGPGGNLSPSQLLHSAEAFGNCSRWPEPSDPLGDTLREIGRAHV